jgi:hypothetical protein
MADDRPIFILGIQRGGTNQVLNILRSHPATYWPQGEFHEVFRPRRLREEGLGAFAKLRRYAPLLATAGDILNPDRRPSRPDPLRGARGEAVRAGLARSAADNAAAIGRYKQALRDQGFFAAAPAPDRMLVKVMNYNVGLAEDLAALYPEARFVGIVRDGLAVCEGHIARGASAEAAAEVYDFVAGRLAALEAAGFPLRTWRFEDLLRAPSRVSQEIYAFCDLDPAATRGVCLQDKERILDAAGKVRGMRKLALYYRFEEMARHMRADVNAGAHARLAPAHRAAIEARCAAVLARFGYGEAAAPAAQEAPLQAAGGH